MQWIWRVIEYYPSLKKECVLTHINNTTWMNFNDIILSEIIQIQKENLGFHTLEVSWRVKFIETESRVVISRDWKEEEWEVII